MTKEIVEEAIGRPKKEQEILNEAKNILREITKYKKDIEYYENEKKNDEGTIKELEHKLDLLRQGKYKLDKSDFGDTGFRVKYLEENK